MKKGGVRSEDAFEEEGVTGVDGPTNPDRRVDPGERTSVMG